VVEYFALLIIESWLAGLCAQSIAVECYFKLWDIALSKIKLDLAGCPGYNLADEEAADAQKLKRERLAYQCSSC
jgi:hypothetical protein